MNGAKKEVENPESDPTKKIIQFPMCPIPQKLATEAFQVAWSEWLEYKAKDLKEPMSERAQRMALHRMEAWGPERAVSAIEYSIERGWQGIFEYKSNNSYNDTRKISLGICPDPSKAILRREI